NCLLVAATVVLLYRVTLQCFGRPAAWLAALLYAFYPLAIYFNLSLISETLANFLLVLFVWCCLQIRSERGLVWTVAAGLVFGVLLLCKPGVVFLIPLLPLWAWVVCGKNWILWGRAALIPLLAGLVMTPWIIRNRLVMGALIPFSTSGVQLLLCTNNRIVVEDPLLYGYSVIDQCLPEYKLRLRAVNDEVQRDALAKQLAIEWLLANSDKWFYLAQGKFFRFWTP